MTRPDESPLEVRPSIDHLLTAKRNTRIAWNVRTMYQTREADQVAYEMKKYNIQVLGLNETRWNGAGQTKLAIGEHIIYPGHEDEDHARTHGVAIIATQNAMRACMEWDPVSPRIITARFKSIGRNASVIQCYAPTND